MTESGQMTELGLNPEPLGMRRIAAAAGPVAGLLALGVAAGMLVERTVVRRVTRADPQAKEPLGQLRSTPILVQDSMGGTLHVEVEECSRPNPEGITIIFSHGYALNLDCWHFQRRDLRALGRMVFWDQRSHGRSSRSLAESHTIEQLGDDLHSVIKAVAPQGPIVLVGHSMGGMTIMALALEQPELFGDRVRAVALLSTSPGGLQDVSLGLPSFAAKPLHWLLPVAATFLIRNTDVIEVGRSKVNDLTLLLTRYYSFGPSAPQSLTEFTHQMLSETPIDVISEFIPALQSHDRAEAMETMAEVPALIMVGADDRMTPQEHSAEMASRLPLAEFEVIPDTGHMMLLEHYEQVNDQLRRLVARVRADLAP